MVYLYVKDFHPIKICFAKYGCGVGVASGHSWDEEGEIADMGFIFNIQKRYDGRGGLGLERCEDFSSGCESLFPEHALDGRNRVISVDDSVYDIEYVRPDENDEEENNDEDDDQTA